MTPWQGSVQFGACSVVMLIALMFPLWLWLVVQLLWNSLRLSYSYAQRKFLSAVSCMTTKFDLQRRTTYRSKLLHTV